jgi:hypothetical protein
MSKLKCSDVYAHCTKDSIITISNKKQSNFDGLT